MHAIQKVWNHAAMLLREFEMHAFYCCDRREVRQCDVYVRHILDRMTTYAATVVHRHLNGRIPRLPVENLHGQKVHLFFNHDLSVSCCGK